MESVQNIHVLEVQSMDKLKVTGLNLGHDFNSRLGRACIGRAILHITKQPNLRLKTRPKQLLGFLPLARLELSHLAETVSIILVVWVFHVGLIYFKDIISRF